MQIPEPIKELRPHIIWDGTKEGMRLMLPFLAGLGAREWFHEYATALMWTVALVVAGCIAFWDRLSMRPPSKTAQNQEPVSKPDPGLLKEIETLTENLAESQEEARRRNDVILEAEKSSLAQQIVRASVWHLKAGAREIKRNWPGSDFLDRPACKDLWITERLRPAATAGIDDRGWLNSAIRWYEKLYSSDVVKGVDLRNLQSLDFDEFIEFLDFYECQQCGDGYALPLPFSIAPAGSPAASIVRFEIKSSRFGAILKNHDERAAFDVRIVPFRIGKYRFSFADTVNTLTKEQGEVFIEAMVEAPGEIRMGFSVFDAVRERFLSVDDGFVPVNARLTYRDSANKHYACRHQFEQHVTNAQSAYTSVILINFELYN
jgi:hypothetical protein